MATIHRMCFPDPWVANAFFDYFDKTEWDGVFGIAATEKNITDKVIGFILGRTCFDTNDILTFAIYPDFQNQGLGKCLLRDYLEMVPQTCLLEVATTNKAAIYLYKKFGFDIILTRRDYYNNADPNKRDAYVMERKAL